MALRLFRAQRTSRREFDLVHSDEVLAAIAVFLCPPNLMDDELLLDVRDAVVAELRAGHDMASAGRIKFTESDRVVVIRREDARELAKEFRQLGVPRHVIGPALDAFMTSGHILDRIASDSRKEYDDHIADRSRDGIPVVAFNAGLATVLVLRQFPGVV